MAQNSNDPKKPVLPPTNISSPQPVLVKGHTHTKGKTTINIGGKSGSVKK